jgi:DNA-binding NarL/FixJ family response regulator
MEASRVARTETPTKFLAVIEDDPDVQLLIETIFSMDSRFSAANAAETAEEALESARKTEPEIIILDHGLAGSLTGLDAAPLLKELAPRAKIILFTAQPSSGPVLQLSTLSTRSCSRPTQHGSCPWLND